MSGALDLVFLQDATGSQGPYIQSAREGIATICNEIIASQKVASNNLRFGLVAFRDYPPQDNTMLTYNYGFTPQVSTMQNWLAGLAANGGGDGPEAQAAAMGDALKMPWRADAEKVVVLITDAPPHGIGDSDDYWPQGSPDKQDPLNYARQMAKKGIVLHVIACEPTLSTGYKQASSFYQAIVNLTGGRMLPLREAAELPHYIHGASVETLGLNNILLTHGVDITSRLQSGTMSLDDCANHLCHQLSQNQVEIDCLHVHEGYVDTEDTKHNIEIWQTSHNLDDARPKLRSIEGTRLEQSMHTSKAPSVAKAPIQKEHAMRMVMQCYARIN